MSMRFSSSHLQSIVAGARARSNRSSRGRWDGPQHTRRHPGIVGTLIDTTKKIFRVGRRPLSVLVSVLVVSGIPVLLSPASGASVATITAGDSKAHCIDLGFPDGVLNQSEITAAGNVTGVTYNCLSVFADPTADWHEWEAPWMLSYRYEGWTSWLAESSAHQVVVGMDLIPQSESDNIDPLTWEQPCANGNYDQYATTLAQNLVSYGAGNIVIRLGVEANGDWEDDYVGRTSSEMNAWATCYDNEVAAMRAVPGANFLFVWNPNICVDNLPLSEWYPGNSYVDIIGADAYDIDCWTLRSVSQEGWTAYFTDRAANILGNSNFPSLANVQAFAAANGKPMSFPEWGLIGGWPDDASYVDGIAQMFNENSFSFESYFDSNTDAVIPLGSAIPNATNAYVNAFG
jgi:Glycosyl hydrolase family 26